MDDWLREQNFMLMECMVTSPGLMGRKFIALYFPLTNQLLNYELQAECERVGSHEQKDCVGIYSIALLYGRHLQLSVISI